MLNNSVWTTLLLTNAKSPTVGRNPDFLQTDSRNYSNPIMSLPTFSLSTTAGDVAAVFATEIEGKNGQQQPFHGVPS
jgi:hypothetical protein